jgi:hypothetical protein
VDLARGVALDAGRRAQVDRHVRECRSCAARLEDERAISAALLSLARSVEEPVTDPDVERTLLAAFDSAWATRPSQVPWNRWRRLAAAALLLLAATLTWTIANRLVGSPASAPAASGPAVADLPATEFIPWPGASSLPTFESGQLMRMDLPASVAVSLGLAPPAPQTGVVRADILVGQDGFARAVRLAP